ncbi:MAG: beta-3-deoxy-D-manno-oct-2-ulosonic acid transferase [Thiomonas sp.]|nr:beta-3-deoxy-D-manno-oct-2-ulosonic acid transferase [Thiomonas sp.]
MTLSADWLEAPPDAAHRLQKLPGVLHVVAFPRWKWPVIRQCFPGRTLRFIASENVPPDARCLVLWGKADVPQGAGAEVQILRVEDGFLRSVGLGAELVRPLSWVVDTRGIYYDARQESDLEWLLGHAAFAPELLARARALRERIVASGLTKYNVGGRVWQRPALASQVILVPGQVESDASIAFGAGGLRRNMDLLRQVRQDHPNACIVYKPHPDVAARLRKTGVDEERALDWCDAVLPGVPMNALLDAVDEVHVLTSLAGFEALLRGKAVTCHGQPFYAGWGLTADRIPHPRRQRTLQLDELVAATLILYPIYLSRDRWGLSTPERALDELAAWKVRKGPSEPWWTPIYRFFLRRFIGVR